MTTPDLPPLLHEHAGLGTARHQGRFSTETVEALILDSHQRLATTARITTHLNILAERLAADIVVTLGCGDACPVVPGRRYLDWPTADPHGASLTELRRIRDAVDAHVRDLVAFLASPSITTETK